MISPSKLWILALAGRAVVALPLHKKFNIDSDSHTLPSEHIQDADAEDDSGGLGSAVKGFFNVGKQLVARLDQNTTYAGSAANASAHGNATEASRVRRDLVPTPVEDSEVDARSTADLDALVADILDILESTAEKSENGIEDFLLELTEPEEDRQPESVDVSVLSPKQINILQKWEDNLERLGCDVRAELTKYIKETYGFELSGSAPKEASSSDQEDVEGQAKKGKKNPATIDSNAYDTQNSTETSPVKSILKGLKDHGVKKLKGTLHSKRDDDETSDDDEESSKDEEPEDDEDQQEVESQEEEENKKKNPYIVDSGVYDPLIANETSPVISILKGLKNHGLTKLKETFHLKRDDDDEPTEDDESTVKSIVKGVQKDGKDALKGMFLSDDGKSEDDGEHSEDEEPSEDEKPSQGEDSLAKSVVKGVKKHGLDALKKMFRSKRDDDGKSEDDAEEPGEEDESTVRSILKGVKKHGADALKELFRSSDEKPGDDDEKREGDDEEPVEDDESLVKSTVKGVKEHGKEALRETFRSKRDDDEGFDEDEESDDEHSGDKISKEESSTDPGALDSIVQKAAQLLGGNNTDPTSTAVDLDRAPTIPAVIKQILNSTNENREKARPNQYGPPAVAWGPVVGNEGEDPMLLLKRPEAEEGRTNDSSKSNLIHSVVGAALDLDAIRSGSGSNHDSRGLAKRMITKGDEYVKDYVKETISVFQYPYPTSVDKEVLWTTGMTLTSTSATTITATSDGLHDRWAARDEAPILPLPTGPMGRDWWPTNIPHPTETNWKPAPSKTVAAVDEGSTKIKDNELFELPHVVRENRYRKDTYSHRIPWYRENPEMAPRQRKPPGFPNPWKRNEHAQQWADFYAREGAYAGLEYNPHELLVEYEKTLPEGQRLSNEPILVQEPQPVPQLAPEPQPVPQPHPAPVPASPYFSQPQNEQPIILPVPQRPPPQQPVQAPHPAAPGQDVGPGEEEKFEDFVMFAPTDGGEPFMIPASEYKPKTPPKKLPPGAKPPPPPKGVFPPQQGAGPGHEVLQNVDSPTTSPSDPLDGQLSDELPQWFPTRPVKRDEVEVRDYSSNGCVDPFQCPPMPASDYSFDGPPPPPQYVVDRPFTGATDPEFYADPEINTFDQQQWYGEPHKHHQASTPTGPTGSGDVDGLRVFGAPLGDLISYGGFHRPCRHPGSPDEEHYECCPHPDVESGPSSPHFEYQQHPREESVGFYPESEHYKPPHHPVLHAGHCAQGEPQYQPEASPQHGYRPCESENCGANDGSHAPHAKYTPHLQYTAEPEPESHACDQPSQPLEQPPQMPEHPPQALEHPPQSQYQGPCHAHEKQPDSSSQPCDNAPEPQSQEPCHGCQEQPGPAPAHAPCASPNYEQPQQDYPAMDGSYPKEHPGQAPPPEARDPPEEAEVRPDGSYSYYPPGHPEYKHAPEDLEPPPVEPSYPWHFPGTVSGPQEPPAAPGPEGHECQQTPDQPPEFQHC